MAARNPAAHGVDLDDIQALLRFGLKHHTECCLLLLRVRDAPAARAWLAQAPIASAVAVTPLPATLLQVALSAPGMLALGISADLVQRFSPEFIGGMGTDPNRARRLGDIGEGDPRHWRWGGAGAVPHVLAMLYALPGQLATFRQAVIDQCAAGFDVPLALVANDMNGKEPFGFADGIAQPQPDWRRVRPVQDRDVLAYTNLSCLGEFVLGYPNEYGRYTDRPLLDPALLDPTLLDPALLDPTPGTAQSLPRAEDAPAVLDLGRNGSYLVLRQLQQDVRGFWQYLDRQAGGDAAQRQALAEAMVGRRMSGEPLLPRAERTIDGVGPDPADLRRNGFLYDADPEGVRCPLGAHIRRSNPRNADLPRGAAGLLARLRLIFGFKRSALPEDLVASTRFHRLLRRGRAYGAAPHAPEQLLAGADAPESGLYFMCLNANLARQFEFVQGAWQMSTKFAGRRDETDPLLGNRCPVPGLATVDTFSQPQAAGPDRRAHDLPRFVSVVGGGYFFLPGIRALRFLVQNTSSPVGS